MVYEVHYCSVLEYSIYKMNDAECLIENGNKRFKTFTAAKKHLLSELKRERELFNKAIKHSRSLNLLDCL